MLKRYHHIVGGAFRVVDACVIGAAWIASYWLRFHLPIIEVTKGFPKFEKYAALTPLVVALWMITFSSMGIYQSRRMLRRTDEAHLLLRAHATAMLFFISITYLFSEYKYSRGVMIYFGVIGTVLLVAFRLILRNSLRHVRRRGFNLRHVLIVGEGSAVESLIHKLDKFPELGFRTVGVVAQSGSPASLKGTIGGKKILGHFDRIHELIIQTRPDRVVIALPRNQYTDLDRILSSLKDETVDIQLIPDIHEFVTLGCEIEDFDGLPLVNINETPLYGWAALAKRLTDIIVSAIALLALTPVMILIAAAIKLTSKGPIFYRQERMGLDGRAFDMIKFRSMKVDAESQTGAVWARPNDDRRTVLGSFLRATSLDELPQFWNVLVGDMSLVGPRPERPVFVHKFRHDIPHYMLRHKVKAGITGWAQVNGWRGDTSLERRIECDLYYIRNWSYLMDWKIMLMTVWKGFVNKNAY